jgi:hypothetical protein
MDNLKIQTVDGERVVRSSEEGGVHLPHNFVRLIDGAGTEYSPSKGVPIELEGSITLQSSAINLALDHVTSSIAVWGNTQGDGMGSPYAVLVDDSGRLQVDVVGGVAQTVGDSPTASQLGLLAMAIRQDVEAPLGADGTYVPLQTNANGALRITLGGTGFGGADVTLAGSPDYLTIVGQVITRNLVDLGSDMTGNLSPTHLNSGIGASASTFWRGDGSWVTPAGSGDVAKVGTPVNDQVGIWTGDGTIEGNAALTFDGSQLTADLAAATTLDSAAIYVTGGTDVSVADGGTGSSSPSPARINLGLAIGVDVQAHSSVLDATTASFLIADETKLDDIEALANVTDATNVAASGAVMADGTGDDITGDIVFAEKADHSSVPSPGKGYVWTKNTSPSTLIFTDDTGGDTILGSGGGGGDMLAATYDPTSVVGDAFDMDNMVEGASKIFTSPERVKLTGIEALADVTDTTNVTAAGALMDSEVDANLQTFVLPASTTISTFGADLVDDLSPAVARATLDVDQAGTDNSVAVTLAGSLDYLTLSGQEITRNAIDLTTDTTGELAVADGGTGSTAASPARIALGVAIGTDVQAWSAVLDATTASFLITDETKLDNIEALADVTDATNVDAAGATMNTDSDVSGNTWVLDEDSLSTDSNTKVPTQQSVKAYVDTAVTSVYDIKGGYNASTNTPDLDTTPSGILTGDTYKVSVAGTFFTEAVGIGDTLVADQNSPTLLTHWTRLQSNIDVATTTVPGIVELATDGEVAANVVVQGNDARLSDARTPTAHAASHVGADAIQSATAAQDGLATSTQITKLDDIEALADVTDTANVTSAGALMDSEVDANLQTFVLPASTTISAFGASLVDDISPAVARTTLGVDAAGTDNSTNVTLAGSLDYLTLSGQEITRNAIDLTTDVTGDLPVAEGGTGASAASPARINLGLAIGSDVQAWDSVLDATTASFLTADETKLDNIDTNVETLTLPASTTISAFGATLVDDLSPVAARVTLDVDASGTDNSTDVTLAVGLDYLTIDGSQIITLGSIDLTADVTGDLPIAEGGTAASAASPARINLGLAIGSDIQAWSADLDLVTGTNTGDEVAASASEIITGSDLTKYVTPFALRGATLGSPTTSPVDDADYIPRLNTSGELDADFLNKTNVGDTISLPTYEYNNLLSSPGAPSDNSGIANDKYVDETTGDVYVKQADTVTYPKSPDSTGVVYTPSDVTPDATYHKANVFLPAGTAPTSGFPWILYTDAGNFLQTSPGISVTDGSFLSRYLDRGIAVVWFGVTGSNTSTDNFFMEPGTAEFISISPENFFPEKDAIWALGFFKANGTGGLDNYDLDPARVGIVGTSSGAQTVAWGPLGVSEHGLFSGYTDTTVDETWDVQAATLFEVPTWWHGYDSAQDPALVVASHFPSSSNIRATSIDDADAAVLKEGSLDFRVRQSGAGISTTPIFIAYDEALDSSDFSRVGGADEADDPTLSGIIDGTANIHSAWFGYTFISGIAHQGTNALSDSVFFVKRGNQLRGGTHNAITQDSAASANVYEAAANFMAQQLKPGLWVRKADIAEGNVMGVALTAFPPGVTTGPAVPLAGDDISAISWLDAPSNTLHGTGSTANQVLNHTFAANSIIVRPGSGALTPAVVSAGALLYRDQAGNDIAFDQVVDVIKDSFLLSDGNTVPPSPGNDTGDGYIVGSTWVDETADEAYVALDVTASTAEWKNITAPATISYFAEENANLNSATNSGFQFSFGNGGAGSANGLTVPVDCTLRAWSWLSGSATCTGTVVVTKDGTATAASITGTTVRSKTESGLSIAFPAGSYVNFQTTATGTNVAGVHTCTVLFTVDSPL